MDERRVPGRVLAALAVVTGASLTFQVVLTRTLAAMLAYHYGFLAISLSLLGIGAAGLYVYVRPGWFERRSLEQALSTWALVYAAALIVAPLVIVHLDYHAGYQSGLGPDTSFAWTLAIATVVSAIPAFASGVVVALAIRGYVQHIGRVYAVDLLGAGAGALLAVPAMSVMTPPEVMLALAVIVALAAVCFAARLPSARIAAIGTAVAVVVLVVGMTTSIVEPAKNYFSSPRTIVEKWTPLSRVLGYTFRKDGGEAGAIVYDQAWAPVPAVVNGVLPDWETLSLGPQSVGFTLENGGRALVVGGGGGRDIENALTSGIADVDVIELNSAIRDLVDHQLGALSGSPYTMPHVQTAIGDGRAVLARRSTKYDEIHIGFTDTLSPDSAEGFALSESNLYTREAFDEYLDHLTPNGILNVSRLRHLVGPEALRITVLTLAALQHHGIENPDRNVVVLQSHDFLGSEYETVLARLKPWTPAQLQQLRSLAALRNSKIMFAPGGPYASDWARLHTQGWNAFCTGFRYNVCPPTDDAPFFFNMIRPRSILHEPKDAPKNDPVSILLVTLLILLGCAIAAFVLPLILVRRQSKPPSARSLSYFAAIGLGYLLVEVVFIQRFVLFLGFPTYSLSVVLFALLSFSGLGAAITPRLGFTRRTLASVLAAIVVLLVVAALFLQSVLASLIQQPFAVRVLLSVLVIAPIGTLLGVAMPIGLRRFEAQFDAALPYAWAVNGLASVVASVLGVAIALFVGFQATTLTAAVCYGIAFLHARFGGWPAGEADAASVAQPAPEPLAVGG